ncbi:MAG: chemotaxis protein CheA [Bacteroidetes bacterium]|nr:chemotaxis protein CheA [Bacteroidota bacterium]
MSSQSFSQFDGEMAELLESFIVETNEIYEKLGPDLLELEKNPTDKELHNRIFRAVHTVKGTSGFLGLDQMTELAHVFEDVLNKIRKGELEVTRHRMDVMFDAFDVLKELLARVESRNAEPMPLEAITARLTAITTDAGAEAVAAAVPVAAAAAAPEPAAAADAKDADHANAPQDHDHAETKQRPADNTAHPATARLAESTIRVDVARLDELMNLVGELVLGRNRLSQINFKMNESLEGNPLVKDLADTSSQVDLITTELQMAVMKTRMVQIAKVFNKLPRLVRDLSRELGKEIELEMYGEETELDKSIIEEINDPLVHILRNAADHGVEMPEERVRKGKDRKGKIVVKADHEGNHIVISIADDGKGIDPERIKAKAIEKGVITPAQAEDMSKREILNLIFAPGFSTAEKVSAVSGRGVGMDVVKTNITKLKGIVDIESETGQGSTIIIKLPLTLAIIQGLLVQSHGEAFAIPLNSVLEVVRVRKEDIKTVKGYEVITLRDSVLSLARLGQIFSVDHQVPKSDWLYIVVVGLAEQRLGIIVDSLLGQREVVIKSLGDYLGTIEGIAGSTILGDGKVIMILDVGQFMTMVRKKVLTRQSYEEIVKDYSAQQPN